MQKKSPLHKNIIYYRCTTITPGLTTRMCYLYSPRKWSGISLHVRQKNILNFCNYCIIKKNVCPHRTTLTWGKQFSWGFCFVMIFRSIFVVRQIDKSVKRLIICHSTENMLKSQFPRPVVVTIVCSKAPKELMLLFELPTQNKNYLILTMLLHHPGPQLKLPIWNMLIVEILR